MLPNFIVVGAQKSASTFVQVCLAEHPDIFMPSTEIPFFVSPDYEQKSINNLKHFFIGRTEKMLGIKRPDYIGKPEVPERIRKTWGPMIETYLTTRQNLKGVVHILDIRRIPSQEDMNLITFLDHHQIPFIGVLTKSDKLKKNKKKTQHRQIADTLSVNKEHLLLFSAKTREGKTRVWEAIDGLAGLS